MNYNLIIDTQISSIEDISRIIDQQIIDIERIGKSETDSDAVEELKRAELLVTKSLYLKFFNNIVIFILEKLKTEKQENFKFYLPNIRTLFEIYAQLLYLCNQNTNKQMAICIANRLLAIKFSSEYYHEQYINYKPFLNRENINIPSNNTELSKNKIKLLGLNYPIVKYMIREEYIRSSYLTSINTHNMTEWFCVIYGHLCNYVHGNILVSKPYGREKLWIISIMPRLSSFMSALIDVRVLRGNRSIEIINWLNTFNKSNKIFDIMIRNK